jgi:hypothetical protein
MSGAPMDHELHALMLNVIAQLMKLLTRRGVLVEGMGQSYLAASDDDGDGEDARWRRPSFAA